VRNERPIEWATLLHCILEVSGSNFFTVYTDGGLSLFCQPSTSCDSELYSDWPASWTTEESRFNSRWSQAIFLSSRNVQNGFGAHPVSNLVVAGVLLPCVLLTIPLHLESRLQMRGFSPQLFHIILWRVQGNFTFPFIQSSCILRHTRSRPPAPTSCLINYLSTVSLSDAV